MSPRNLFRYAVAFLCAVIASGGGVPILRAVAADDPFWSAHVEPLLQAKCSRCHSPTKSRSGLDLSSFQSILRGGDHGAAVLPGRPDDSPMVRLVEMGSDPHMPPKEQLSREEIDLLRTWVQRLTNSAHSTATASTADPKDPVGTDRVKTPKSRIHPRASWTPERAIDAFLAEGWRNQRVQPARATDDASWLRRIHLDLVGRIPTAIERQQFLRDRRKDRRQRVVDALLASPEHARHLAEVMDTVLMGRRGTEWETKRRDNHWQAFLETAFRENRPWDAVVRDLIVARPEGGVDRGAQWFLYERRNNAQAMAEALAPVVFGVQIQCAQCHDHMVAREIKQAHYWGLVAALNRSKNVDTPNGPGVSESAIGGFASFANLRKESQPALMTLFNGRTIPETWPKEGEKESDDAGKYQTPPAPAKESPQVVAVPRFSRRASLAEAVTRDNPLLARAMVNRIWALLLGRGLVHPVELMDSKHPASHPELLDWLAADFARNGHDVRRLIRAIVRTRAYQLDSRPSHDPAPAPETFARAIEKPLTAEQLYRSLRIATGNAGGTSETKPDGAEATLRQAFIRQFPDVFPAEYNASLQQAMFLSNSPLFDALLQPRDGNLVSRLEAIQDPGERVRQTFVEVLGRDPDRLERDESLRYLEAHPGAAGTRHLAWALLTGTEFQTNH